MIHFFRDAVFDRIRKLFALHPRQARCFRAREEVEQVLRLPVLATYVPRKDR